MFPKEALKYYCPETNIRIMTTFEYKKPVEGSKEEYEINYARNQILKNQFRIPMKYLEPDSNNTSGSWNLIDSVFSSISAFHLGKSSLNSSYNSS